MESIKHLNTEQRNPNSSGIDRKSTKQILQIINAEDQKVPLVIQNYLEPISRVVDRVSDALTQGGRLFYIGAGTSGRIGILDASECPPTFGTTPDMVQAIIAGGTEAIFRAVEGIEDNREWGARDVTEAGIGPTDVVIGITASGRAPYVIGALQESRNRGACTVSLTCNYPARLNEYADFHLNIETGPEVIMGSTRMKAGTVQKLVLNMISTASMIKLGKVYDNLMIDVQPLNEKLVERAKRMIVHATDCTDEEAEWLFDQSGGNLKAAIVMHIGKVSKSEAERLLEVVGGYVFKALEALHK